ncbi:TELO2-interacting protein 2 isoform X4 [Vidua chalybeata]|uniref:TELO2-interacting protein 2 isoform X4 n=1 Tax=Vidua chalybeata TaxID=81927 RepID=UPI0023A8C5EF|nr:TELO2-interacting protein 2 isoform X4 [Vidua chalybeata]
MEGSSPSAERGPERPLLLRPGALRELGALLEPAEPLCPPGSASPAAPGELGTALGSASPAAPGELGTALGSASPAALGELAATLSSASPAALGELAATLSSASPAAPGELAATLSSASPAAPGELAATLSSASPAALGELAATLGSASPAALGELAATLGSASPAALGELAAALGDFAAPPRRERDGAEPPGRDTALAAAAAERAERVGAVFLLLLRKLEDARSQTSPGTAAAGPVPLRVLAHAFIFAVTHKDERPWTTARSRAVAQELLERLVQAAGCGSVEEFLRGKEGDEEGRFGAVMGLLKQELTKDTWKCNPASKDVFSWALLRVSRPWLCPHLERVLPPALLLSDDFQEENKVLGVRCLHHIVLNVPGADLCQFNRAQVVFHALYNHLYSREAPLIQAVLLCLLDLLPVLERCQRRQGQGRATSPWDQVLQLVLTHMEAEHRLALRRVYAGTLPAFVTRLGILIVRHLKRLERVILGYLEVSDGPEEEARLGILETLRCTMEHAWPRMPCRLPVLLKALLRLLWDVHTERGPTPEPVRAALLHGATQCLILLDRCCQGQVKVLLAGLHSSCEQNRVQECLRKVQEST